MAVLGLDGMPLDLARNLCERGVMPNLEPLVLSDRATSLRAELPELSPVNWTSFYTASGPGEHGVFGFTMIDPATYEISIADSSRVAGPTIFDALGEAGLTCKVVNLPNTYPARPIKGMLVAGFPAPEMSRAVHPPMLAGMLARAGYRLEAETEAGLTDCSRLLGDLNGMLDARRAALDLLWPDLAWDLFVFVITETDRLFHFLFHALEDENHALHADCLAFMRSLDGLAGEFLERFEALPDPKRLMVLADHGFTRMSTELDVNSVLMREGLLKLGAPPGSELDMRAVSPESKCLALDPGRIYIHTRGRFGRGSLSDVEAPRVAEHVKALFEGLETGGRPVVRRAHPGSEIYSGPLARLAPDIVLEPEPGVSLTAKLDGREPFGLRGRSGAHTADGALFFDSDGFRPALMRETGARVLDFFGLHRHNAGEPDRHGSKIITSG
jgi:predicted AlkP superfamily phosphohydrolase/phosphomutase